MTLPTKRELDLENAELRAENTQLRDMLAAVHEVAASIKRPDDSFGDLSIFSEHMRDRLLRVEVLADLSTHYKLTARAFELRAYAAEPLPYQPYRPDVDVDPFAEDIARINKAARPEGARF